MSVEQRSVETFEERLYCDECGCEMKHTGIFLACNPLLYPHKCIVCGHTVNMHEVYPRLSYQEGGHGQPQSQSVHNRPAEKGVEVTSKSASAPPDEDCGCDE